MSIELTEANFGKIMLEGFRSMPEAAQERAAILAGNADFVLRMTAGTQSDTEVGKAIAVIRDALSRMVPSLKE